MPMKVISKDAWPKYPIERYRSIGDGPWGYLLVYEDLSFEFVEDSVPSAPEILARWGHYLVHEPRAQQG